MSKVAKGISTIASVVAVVAPFFGPVGAIVGAVAAAVSVTAGIVAQVTAKQKRPGFIGAVNSVIIGANMAIPYAVGRTFVAGAQVYDDSGGNSASGIVNGWRQSVRVLTGGGPIDSFEGFYADFSPISFSGGYQGAATGYYAGFLDNQVRFGNWPEEAHNYSFTAMPNWSGSHRLSGYASYRVAMQFDKNGEKYSGGVPQFGMVGKWVKVYDPRKDSTYPGGSGSHRWDDERTWEWSENGALHALTYARGRFIEVQADGYPRETPIKVLGCGFSKDSIRISDFVEAANLADANGWKCGGLIFDGPGISRWENLKRFCETFAAQPVHSGGQLGLKFFAPRPSLFTLTADDLADGSIELRAMKAFQDRRNTVVYRYRSEAHRWEHVQGERITIASYLDDDGEERTEEVTWDLVQDKDQGAALAAAKLIVDRQFGPLTVPCKPRLINYVPGEAGTVNLPEAGLANQKMVITGRQVDPGNGTVTLTLESEPSDAEYLFALTRTGTAPPTPVIRTPDEVDTAAIDFRPNGLTGDQADQLSAIADLLDGRVNFFYTPSEPSAGEVATYALSLESSGRIMLEDSSGALAGESATGGGSAAEGDVWYNPDNEEWRRFEDGVWVLKDGFGALGEALLAAFNAQSLADGAASIFYTDADPSSDPAITLGVGDLWIKGSGEGRTIKAWTGSVWEELAEVGADVTSYIVPSSDKFSVQADSTGVKTGQLPRAISASLVRNGVSITSGISWSYRVVSGSFNTKVPADGYVSVSGAGVLDLSMTDIGSGGAKIELRSEYAGTFRTRLVEIVLVGDAPPSGGGTGGGGTGGSASSISSFYTTTAASNTYGISDNEIPAVSTSSVGRLTMSASISVQIQAFGEASARPYALFQYRMVGGSWIDAGTEYAGTVAENYRDAESGQLIESTGAINYSVVVNGLSLNTAYETRLRLRDDSTTRSLAFYGNAGTQGS